MTRGEKPEAVDPGQLLDIVAADLRYLTGLRNPRVDDHWLRRASPILRRLLVEGDLQKAWKAAGFAKEPRITAVSLRSLLARVPAAEIPFAVAGGGKHGMGTISNISLIPTRVAAAAEDTEREATETVGLEAFCQAPCLVLGGKVITRRLLVSFIANTQGGAHLGYTRGKADSRMQKLHSVLHGRRVQPGVTDLIYYELLSTGQAVVDAADVQTLYRRIAPTA